MGRKVLRSQVLPAARCCVPYGTGVTSLRGDHIGTTDVVAMATDVVAGAVERMDHGDMQDAAGLFSEG